MTSTRAPQLLASQVRCRNPLLLPTRAPQLPTSPPLLPVARAVRRASCLVCAAIGWPVSTPRGSSGAGAPSPEKARPSKHRGKQISRKGHPQFHAIERPGVCTLAASFRFTSLSPLLSPTILPGSLIGLHDPNEGSVLYPYTIVASKTASLLRITASDLHSILTAHGGADEQAGRSLMLSEFEAIQAGMLKGNRQVSFTKVLHAPPSSSSRPSRALPHSPHRRFCSCRHASCHCSVRVR